MWQNQVERFPLARIAATLIPSDNGRPGVRSLVCYPTGQLHRVREVTRGERLVVVSWIQSHVRDGSAREVLRDLALATDALTSKNDAPGARDLINKTHANLLRRWSEP